MVKRLTAKLRLHMATWWLPNEYAIVQVDRKDTYEEFPNAWD